MKETKTDVDTATGSMEAEKTLFDLLYASFPNCRTRRFGFDLSVFSAQLKVHRTTVESWIIRNTIPAHRIKEIVKLSGGCLTEEQLQKFAPSFTHRGELYSVLSEAFPVCEDAHGRFSPKKFASLLGITAQAVHGWLETNRIPQNRVLAVIEASKGKLTIESLHRFIFK